MITPPLSISARPALTVKVASSRAVSVVLAHVSCQCTRAIPSPDRGSTGSLHPDGDGRFVATELALRAVGPRGPARRRPGGPADARVRAARPRPRAAARRGHLRARSARSRSGRSACASEVVRPGRRVQLLEASLLDAGRHRGRPRAGAADWRPPRLDAEPPTTAAAARTRRRAQASDSCRRSGRCSPPDAMEIRFVEGAFRGPGPATAWFRLRVPLLAGEPTGAAPASRRRRRLRQRHRAPVLSWDDARVHQPRPDALRRARAGRRVGRARSRRRASRPGGDRRWPRAFSATSAGGSGAPSRPCSSRPPLSDATSAGRP